MEALPRSDTRTKFTTVLEKAPDAPERTTKRGASSMLYPLEGRTPAGERVRWGLMVIQAEKSWQSILATNAKKSIDQGFLIVENSII